MDKKQLIVALNEDLEGEMGAVLQYMIQASLLKGPYHHHTEEFLRQVAKDELEHVEELSEKIVDLGGKPSIKPRSFKETFQMDEILKYNIEQELDAIKDYSAHIKMAEDAGDVGVRLLLEHIIEEEYGHLHEFQRLLGK